MLAKVLQCLPGVPFQLHGGRVDLFSFSANKFGGLPSPLPAMIPAARVRLRPG